MKKLIAYLLLAAIILTLLPHARANGVRFGELMAEYFVRARISDEVLTNFGLAKTKDFSVHRREQEFHNIFSEGEAAPQFFAKRAHHFERLIQLELMIEKEVSQEAIDRAAEEAFQVNGMTLSPDNMREFMQISDNQNASRMELAFADLDLSPTNYINNVKSSYVASQINALLFGPKKPTRRLVSVSGQQYCEVMLRNDVLNDSLQIDIDGSIMNFGMTAKEELNYTLETLLVTATNKDTGTKFYVKRHLSGRTLVATFGVVAKNGTLLKSCTVKL